MRKRVLTGIKPTGMPHIGNVFGAINPALKMASSADTECFLFIADYHALTSVHDAKQMRQGIYEVAAAWLALGLDPNSSVIYKQSDIPEILELSFILSCFTAKGLMNRAHAYKALVQAAQEAGKKDQDVYVNMGVYTYPILMSADILCFDSDAVPVGEDQLQHLEICRDIAAKVNHNYGSVLKLPEPIIQKSGKLVNGLDGRKMSKSYNNSIPIFVPEKKLRKLVMKIKTDSLPPEAPKDPDQSILFDYFCLFAGEDEALISSYRNSFVEGISWGEAKQQLFELINSKVKDQRTAYNDLMENPAKVDDILNQGAEKARAVASQVLGRVKKSIGVHV